MTTLSEETSGHHWNREHALRRVFEALDVEPDNAKLVERSREVRQAFERQDLEAVERACADYKVTVHKRRIAEAAGAGVRNQQNRWRGGGRRER